MMKKLFFAALICLGGCALNPGESRKITAWGFWAVVFGEPVGIGYWHSERGPSKDIDSEQSAKPPSPTIQNPKAKIEN